MALLRLSLNRREGKWRADEFDPDTPCVGCDGSGCDRCHGAGLKKLGTVSHRDIELDGVAIRTQLWHMGGDALYHGFLWIETGDDDGLLSGS